MLIRNATASTYSLIQDDVGAVITVTASYSDGQGTEESVTSSATSAVVNVNDEPILSGTPAVLANGTEDLAYTINASDLLQGYSDPDGDTLLVTDLTSSVGSLVDNSDGTWTLTTTQDFYGNIDLSYSVTDGNGGSIDATQSFSSLSFSGAPISSNGGINLGLIAQAGFGYGIQVVAGELTPI